VLAIAERLAAGAAAATEPHRLLLIEPQLVGDASGTEMGAIAKPAVARASAGAEEMNPRREHQRFGTRFLVH